MVNFRAGIKNFTLIDFKQYKDKIENMKTHLLPLHMLKKKNN